MTITELVLDCLKLGLDGEKVDYECESEKDGSVKLRFEDGREVRVTLTEVR